MLTFTERRSLSRYQYCLINKFGDNKMMTMKHRFTYFSEHALKRLNERTQLTVDCVADIIDMGLAIDTGTEPVFNRKHWLIYSKLDKSFFVVIQDAYTGFVVTVLPMEYHENLAWKVDEMCFIEAKNNIEGNNIPAMLHEFRKRLNSEPPKSIQIKIRYVDSRNAAKTKSLFKLTPKKKHRCY